MIKLEIRHSLFLRLAPVILWAMVILAPLFVGSRLYFESLRQNQQEIGNLANQHLMTRAQQFMAQLTPKRIISRRIDADNIESIHLAYDSVHNPKEFESLPTVQALPGFNLDMNMELNRFSEFFSQKYGFEPEFLMAVDKNPDKCGIKLSARLAINSEKSAQLKLELASMSVLLNRSSYYHDDLPHKFRYLADLPTFNASLGITHYFTTRLWRLNSRFSGRFNQQLFLITMRYPGENGNCNYLLTGITIDRISKTSILRNICQALNDDQIGISVGYSTAKVFPFFVKEANQVALITELPSTFINLFARTQPEKDERTLVIKFSSNTETLQAQTEKHISRVSLLLLIVALTSFLLAAGISFGRLNFRAGMKKIIALSFAACLLFPLIAMLWLGILQAQTSRESAVQEAMQAISSKLKEVEMSLQLQSYRRQLFFRYLAMVFEKTPNNRWNQIARIFFSPQSLDLYSMHFFNFYAYNSRDREFFRGQGPDENPQKSEMTRFFVGPARKMMTQLGAFSDLSEAERNRIGQIGDFASGLLDQMMRPELLNQMFKTQGGLFLSDFMARRDLFCSYLIRQGQKISGLLFFLTDNMLLMKVISDLLSAQSIPTSFTVDGYRVDLGLYPTNDYSERSLLNLIQYSNADKPYQIDRYNDIANAVYASSDFNQINNLHLNSPHLIVTDTIFNNSVFAFAYATPVAGSWQYTVVLITLLIIIAIISCGFLATGVARLLLLQLPPFLKAMQEIEKDRYDWQLSLQGGDEFGELAVAINKMRISLFERKKMMQLVSANAIEAAQSGFHGQLAAQRRQAAILFCDIRSFTTISETRSADEVVAMLNTYFSCMCPIIEQHGGFIDKLIGDAIQAVFYGSGEDAVKAAGKAALQMRQTLADFNSEREAAGQFTIDNGIGIAFGMVVTGLVGSQTGKLDAALLGNVLNRAQHLEAQSKFAKATKILLDFEAYRQIRSSAEVDLLPEAVTADSDSEFIRTYELLKLRETSDR